MTCLNVWLVLGVKKTQCYHAPHLFVRYVAAILVASAYQKLNQIVKQMIFHNRQLKIKELAVP